MKCYWITECYYPDPEYTKFNPFERCKVYLDQQEQKKRAGGKTSGESLCSDKPREIHEISTVISVLSASMASVKESCKTTTCDLKRMKKHSGYKDSDNESLFTYSDKNDVDGNHRNAALAHGTLKRKKKKR